MVFVPAAPPPPTSAAPGAAPLICASSTLPCAAARPGVTGVPPRFGPEKVTVALLLRLRLANATSVAEPAVPVVAARMVRRPPAFTVPKLCRTTPAFPTVCKKPPVVVNTAPVETRVLPAELPLPASTSKTPLVPILIAEVLRIEPAAPVSRSVTVPDRPALAKGNPPTVVAPV